MEYPKINKDVVAKDSDGDTHYCYLSKFKEWRCSLTGFGLMIDVISWEYDK